MGNTLSCKTVNFEDLQECIFKKDNYLIINTLPSNQQSCLIKNTSTIDKEEKIINESLQKYSEINIIIYGKNSTDSTIYNKHKQLKELGLKNIYIYSGGLFEWLLLQDIYGEDEFPTTSKELDILKFKPSKYFNNLLLK